MSSQVQSTPASSSYRWVICALLFFATTFNYLDRQVISYLKDYFCRPSHQAADPQTFSRGDIMDLPSFASKLRQPTNAMTAFIKTNLSEATLAALADYKGPASDATPLVTNLVNDLNRVIGTSSIYDPERFNGVSLRPETRQLLDSNPSGKDLLRLNRLLMDDAYPAEISRDGFGWSNTDFANLTSFFTAFYAGMTIIAGWIIDRIGTKIGLALSLIVWSIFGILNAFVGRLVMMHVLVRSAFAVGEGGNFPASIKTVAEWFPKKERALATGIFNSGSNFGAMIAALFVPWCMIHFGDELGWKMAFIVTGAAGFIWLFFWFWLYEIPARQKRLSKAEFDYIHSDRDDAVSEQKPAKGSAFGRMFSFAGRVPRPTFWGTTILLTILTLFIYMMTTLLVIPHIYVFGLSTKDVLENVFVKPDAMSPWIHGFRIGWLVLVGWVFAALQAKRWHDLGKPGALALVGVLPIATWIILGPRGGWVEGVNILAAIAMLVVVFILGSSTSQDGQNEFGLPAGPGVLGHRPTWSFFWGKFLTDGIWWFYLFWLPDYLTKQFNMTKHEIMMPTFIVYGIAIIGSVYGGSIPLTLIKRGMPVYKARMLAMLLIALAPLAVLSTQYFGNVGHFGSMASVLAVSMICIGAAAHQAWSANLFTTVSDMFPKKTVGSVTGIGAMAGGLGGVLVQQLAGGLTDAFKSTPQTAYMIMFIVCAVSYLLAWAVMKTLVPRHQVITDI
ncbi:MAG TPA: MFS transporter [Desulfuromonadaceae bacterium]|nr:MFS transporter [Desulfuromonadaceae bacterium]